MTDTVTLRYTGPANRYRFAAADIDVTPGDKIEVETDRELLTHVDDEGDEHHAKLVTFLTDRHGFEHVDEPDWRSILDGSVDDVRDALATGEFDAHLDALAHQEREGENRTTALDAIDARRDDTAEAE